MPNTKSAAKRSRQTKVRTLKNKAAKSRVRTQRNRVQTAIDAGDRASAEKELKLLASEADRAAKTNVIHKNSASRLKSLLGARVAKLS